MNEQYHAELKRLGFPIPSLTRYIVCCRWRPPKDHWKLRGSAWRDLMIVVDSQWAAKDAAIETCLFLISNNRGTAVAHHVIGPDNEHITLKEHIEFNWSWYDGVVTYGIDVISSADLNDAWEVRQ